MINKTCNHLVLSDRENVVQKRKNEISLLEFMRGRFINNEQQVRH